MESVSETILGLSKQPHDLGTGELCVRAIIVYLIMILFLRMAKKRFLSRATIFDIILGIIIGSTASRAITGNAPFFGALAAVLVLIAMHWLLSLSARDSDWIGWLIKGKADVLIRDGTVDNAELRRAHMSDDDLAEDLREKGVMKPSEVKEARLERSGVLSVVKR